MNKFARDESVLDTAAPAPEAYRARQERDSAGWVSFLLLLSSRAVSLGAGIAFVAVTARLFPARDVAFLAWVSVAAAAAETIRGFGLTNVLMRRLPVATDEMEIRRWIGTHFVWATVPLALAPVVCVPFLPREWMWAAAGSALQLIANNYISIYQAMGRFDAVSAASVASTLAQRVIPLGLAWHWRLALGDFLAAQAILGIPCCLGMTWMLRKYFDFRGRVAWKQFWPEAQAFYLAGFVRYAATQADQVCVALLFAPETLAPYFLLRRLYSAAVMVLSAGVDVLIPQLGRSAAAGLDYIRRRQASILGRAALGLGVGGCLMAANASWLVPIAVGPAYASPPFVVPAMIAAALGYGLFSFALAGEVVAGPPEETLRLVSIAAVVPLLVAPVLVAPFGVAALPLSMVAGYCSAAWRTLQRHAGFHLPALTAAAGLAGIGLIGALDEGAFLATAAGLGEHWFVLNTVAVLIAIALMQGSLWFQREGAR